MPTDPCSLLPPGKMKDACLKAQKDVTNAPDTGGGSILGIPLPGSNWERHFMFRVGEVIVGIAMIIVGVRAFVNASPTTKVVVQAGRKLNI